MPASNDVRRDYAAYVARSVQDGRLRTDREAADIPFDGRDLQRNFLKIAFRQEAFRQQRAEAIPLWRWERPIRYRVLGGSATAADRARVDAFMKRLAALTGVDVQPGEPANFDIYFLDADERMREARRLSELSGGQARRLSGFLHRGNDYSNPCRGTGRRGPGDTIAYVVVLIKDETAGRLRNSCTEEEIAQGFGLINDDPSVTPSLFNDVNIFAVLTDHDAYLLRMLYHPLMRPGMTAQEAQPLLPLVLRDLGVTPSGTPRTPRRIAGGAT